MKHPELFESLGIDQPKVIEHSVHEIISKLHNLGQIEHCLPEFMYMCSPLKKNSVAHKKRFLRVTLKAEREGLETRLIILYQLV